MKGYVKVDYTCECVCVCVLCIYCITLFLKSAISCTDREREGERGEREGRKTGNAFEKKSPSYKTQLVAKSRQKHCKLG